MDPDSRHEKSSTGPGESGSGPDLGNHLHTSLKITTVNIEGVIANKLFLEQLCAQNDFLCLQEHWLWDFQKQWLQNNFSGFKSFARCHDSNDPITNVNIPRGQSGVAIFTVVKPLRQFGSRHPLRCYSKITFK